MNSVAFPTPIRLNGHTLFMGRLIYVLLFILCISMFGLSLSFKFVQGTSGCDSAYNAEWAAQGSWCFEWFQTIEDAGITAVAFEGYFLTLRLITALPFWGLSLLLVWRRGQELRVLLFAGLLLLMGIAGTWFNPFWGWAEGWVYPVVGRLSQLLTFLLIGGAILFACLFPDGRFVPHWSRWLVISFLVLYAGNIFFPDTNAAWDNWPVPLPTLVPLTFILLGMTVIIIRYSRQATAVQRQQIKWVTFGFILVALNLLLDFGVFNIYPALTGSYPLTTGGQALLWELGQDTFSHLSQLALAICFGLAVFRHRLWDIDLILNRTLVYGGLTLIVISIYILTVGLLSLLFHTSGSLVISLVATGFIAVLFQPLHQRLQRGVNRLMFGERDDPTAVLTRLGQRLEAVSQPDAVLPAIVETITQALKLPYAAIMLADELVVAEIGRRSNTPLHSFPLVYQSEMVGQLQVAHRSPGEGLNAADERVLRQVALQAGTAVHTIRLTHDLQQSRIHIVTTREEERRRLRRDLHDELGPVIASQGLKLAAARELLTTDPNTAVRLLDDVLAKNQNTVAEVRRLVYNLRPPSLDELGLVGAIREYVQSSTLTGLKVTVTAPDNLPPLSAAVEAAAYRIMAEAFTNVLRHAAAHHCWIELKVEEIGKTPISNHQSLLLLNKDDGQGLSVNGRAGIGLLSMRERAEEVGGCVRLCRAKRGCG